MIELFISMWMVAGILELILLLIDEYQREGYFKKLWVIAAAPIVALTAGPFFVLLVDR